MARAHTPDVAILDLQMPDRDGISVAAELSSVVPGCASGDRHRARARRTPQARAGGGRARLPPEDRAAQQCLSEVVRTVHRGGRYVDPELAAEAISAGDSPLTPREADVLELAAGGAPVEEIAARAHLSPGTVRNHLSAAAAKLGAPNRHAAVDIARRHGWI